MELSRTPTKLFGVVLRLFLKRIAAQKLVLDRIDIQVEVPEVKFRDIISRAESETPKRSGSVSGQPGSASSTV